MIGELTKTLKVNNVEWAIRSDFRVALNIFEAFNDPELNGREKTTVMLDLLYEDFKSMHSNDYDEAIKQALWYLDGGKNYENAKNTKKVMDWEQDEQIIFSAVNKVASKEIREEKYLHYWTFLGYFNEIGEGLFTTVISIRQKKNRGKKLEKYEQDFYRNYKDLIDLKEKYTEQEQEEMERLKKLFD